MRTDISPVTNGCASNFSAVGRFFGFLVNAVLMNEWNVGDHFSFSFSVGGLKPLFDIRNSARIGCKSNMGGCNSANSVRSMEHQTINKIVYECLAMMLCDRITYQWPWFRSPKYHIIDYIHPFVRQLLLLVPVENIKCIFSTHSHETWAVRRAKNQHSYCYIPSNMEYRWNFFAYL